MCTLPKPPAGRALSEGKEAPQAAFPSWCFPAQTKRRTEGAEAWINFLCRPDIAAINFDYLYYTTPNEAALDLIDEEYLEEESVFPDDETINRCESLVTLDPATTELYSNYWKKVKAE